MIVDALLSKTVILNCACLFTNSITSIAATLNKCEIKRWNWMQSALVIFCHVLSAKQDGVRAVFSNKSLWDTFLNHAWFTWKPCSMDISYPMCCVKWTGARLFKDLCLKCSFCVNVGEIFRYILIQQLNWHFLWTFVSAFLFVIRFPKSKHDVIFNMANLRKS